MHQRRHFSVSVMTYLTERLTRSWTITATSSTATEHLRRWQTRHTEIACFTTVAELAETIRTTDRPTANQLVTILLGEAASAGDHLAKETILNALRYLAIGVWRTHASAAQRLDDDSLCDVLADAVEIIAELAATGASAWPIRQIWNRLECRARRRHQRNDDRQRQTGDWDALTEGDAAPEDTLAAPTPRLDAGTELVAVLAHAVSLGTITITEATIIANKGILDRPIATLAVTRGCSTEAVQKNHRRVLHRLRVASTDIADSYLTPADLMTAA